MRIYVLRVILFVPLVFISPFASSNELSSEPFVSVPLLSTEIKASTANELGDHFISQIGREFLPNKATPAGTYSDAEIKRILSEFDRIVESMSTLIDKVLSSQHERVSQTVSKETWPDKSRLSARLGDWNRANKDFLNKAQTLGVLARVLWAIAPDKIAFPASTQPEYERIFGSLLGGGRYQIQIMLNSEQIAPLLPSRYDVAKLRQQELEIRNTGRQLAYEMTFPDGQLVRTTMALRDWVIPEIRPYLKDKVLPEMERLAARTKCLSRSDKQQCR